MMLPLLARRTAASSAPPIETPPRPWSQSAARPGLLLYLVLFAMPAHAGESEGHPSWKASGDVLQWSIPLTGLAMTFLLKPVVAGDAPGLNWPGPRLETSPRHDFLVSFLRMEVSTYALKYSLNTERPNGGNYSFPSGHTSAAFMGAEFVRKEYSAWWGGPAYVAASWVGYTRVDAHEHFWIDVLGGAAIGIAANHDFDSIDTPLGKLHFGLAILSPDFSGGLGEDDPPCKAPFDLPPPIPGLRFELHF